MDIKTVFENTTPEQRNKALQCKTAEELKQFAKDENIDISAEGLSELFIAIHNKTGEISDDDLDNVAGGKESRGCFLCGAKEYESAGRDRHTAYYKCSKCGHSWGIDLG